MKSKGRHQLPEEVAIPTKYEYDERVNTESIAAVSAFSASVKNTPFSSDLLSPLFTQKEAETSSRIEGTDVTFEDVMVDEETEQGTQKKRDARREARGVIDAIDAGKSAMEKDGLPMTGRVIKRMHKALMESAKLDQGVPGEFRKENVRIGTRYFPPEPQYVENLMADMERYIHDDTNSTNISPMVKIAVIHAQFEIIHPFSDGNGRIGRLLISFLMKEYGLTDDVSYFMSQYFEQHRNEYYNSLEGITRRGDWSGWINFFLQSVAEHGSEMKNKVDILMRLYTDGQFLALKNVNSQHIKNYIFKNPIFTVPSMVRNFERQGVTLSNKNDMHRILKESPDIDVLAPGKGKRQTRYRCTKIVETLQKNNG